MTAPPTPTDTASAPLAPRTPLAWGRAWAARWPGRCAICRTWTPGALCRGCDSRFSSQGTRCTRCALALGGPAVTCGACLTHPPAWDRAVCAEDYTFPWDGLIGELKFHGRVERAGLLAGRLACAVRQADAARGIDLVLPIALSGVRLRERGFNQAWEIARRVARDLGRPAHADALIRTRHTPAQAGLSRADRALNLRGVFEVGPSAQRLVHARHIVLVDDILTTGATFEAAARALRSAGASAISVWAVARTP